MIKTIQYDLAERDSIGEVREYLSREGFEFTASGSIADWDGHRCGVIRVNRGENGEAESYSVKVNRRSSQLRLETALDAYIAGHR